LKRKENTSRVDELCDTGTRTSATVKMTWFNDFKIGMYKYQTLDANTSNMYKEHKISNLPYNTIRNNMLITRLHSIKHIFN